MHNNTVSVHRGVLAIAWSLADPELLLSCGKDSRILCWNPNTAEVKVENYKQGYLLILSLISLHLPLQYSYIMIIMIFRCCTSCPPAVSGALTSSGAPGTLPCCRLQASTATSTSSPSWEAATRHRVRDMLIR